MRYKKVIEAYRPNMNFLGFTLIVQLYFVCFLLVSYVLYKEEIMTLEEFKSMLPLLKYTIYFALSYPAIMLLDLLISMFQWFKRRRKNKDPNLEKIKQIVRFMK